MKLRSLMLAVVSLALSGTAPSAQMRQVSIGLSSTSLVAAAPRIAKEMNLFERHGLDPKFVVMDSANAATTALISRSLETALVGPGELVSAQARGQRVVMLANAYTGLGATLVLSRSVSDKLGVAPTASVTDRLKALDGVVIGTATATSPYTVAFKGAARAAGANPRFTYVAVPAMAAALETGAIQGLIASAPIWFPPVLKGSGVAWISGPKGELPPENTPTSSLGLACLRDFAERHPDVVKGMVGAFADLSDAIERRPADVKAAIAKLFPELDGTAIDLLFASEAPAWKVKALTPNDMVREIEFVKSMGVQIPGIDTVDPASLTFEMK